MHKITVVGSINMDITIKSEKNINMGETLFGSGFMTSPGGKGANQAAAVGKLGGLVNMIGNVGNDAFGKELIMNLKKSNVNTHCVTLLDNIPTGVAIIVVYNGDNCIIIDQGANGMLTPEMIENSYDIIADSNILMCQFEVPYESVKRAMKIAKENGVKVLLNPAPSREIDDEMLSMIDIITPNEHECYDITGIEVSNIEDSKKAINFFRSKGVKNVLITLGEKGVVYNNGDSIIWKEPYKVNVIDTTGAGDSFSGALAYSIANGNDINYAVDFASVVSAITITRRGALRSLPTLEEVYSFKRERGINI